MAHIIKRSLKRTWDFFTQIEPSERLKVFFLSATFFLIIGAYTIAKQLKDSIFVSIVGQGYLPRAKIIATIFVIICIFVYSQLVERMHRHHLLYLYSGLFGVGLLLFAYCFGLPGIGLQNTVASSDRLIGWFYYCFVEAYTPFMISVFWSYSNSVTNPESAKKNYTLIVCGSKLGGMLTALVGWWLLSGISIPGYCTVTDVVGHRIMLFISAIMTLLVPVMVHQMRKKVPKVSLAGYEAAYLVEVAREKQYQEMSPFRRFWNEMVGGLRVFFKYPYVFGIFGMVFFWEILNGIFQFWRLGIVKESSTSICDFSSFLFLQEFYMHLIGLFFVFFGTRALFERLRMRYVVVAIPLLTGSVVLYALLFQSKNVIFATTVIVRCLNYALASPIREALYIPTTKEVMFKAKSWIDAFGAKIGKNAAQGYNVVSLQVSKAVLSSMHLSFFMILFALWSALAYALGRRYERAVKHNEVIGV